MEIPQLSGHIMIVDDEPFILEAFTVLFEKSGCQVTCLGSAIEAISVFKENPAAFDLLIIDQRMPNMTGLELAKAVLEIRPGMPVILMSGYTEVVNREVARQTGIREFIMKPPDVKELCRIIKRLLPTPGKQDIY